MNNVNKKLLYVFAAILTLSAVTYIYDRRVIEPTRIMDRCFSFVEGANINSEYLKNIVLKITNEDKDSYGFTIVKVIEPKVFNDFYAKTVMESAETRLDKSQFRSFFERVSCK